MKPLYQLSNREKAKLIFQLFPEEIPALVTFIGSMCQTILDNEEKERERWNNGFIPFEVYLEQVKEVAANVAKYGQKLGNSPNLFTEKLFSGFLALPSNHATVLFVTVRQHPNHKFAKAIDLLLNP